MKRIFFANLLMLLAMVAGAQTYSPELHNGKVKIQPAIDIQAYAFDMGDVKLLDGSPFKNAMNKDAAYLLQIDVDRLLHRFHKFAGLSTKGEIYGGWESEGLSGHSLGHYLSAIALFSVTDGNPEFKKRLDYIVDELERCQNARKSGYVGAIPDEDSIFAKVSRGEIRSGGFDLNGGWSPWYTVHKVMGGLFDAYLYANNEKALKVLKGMADWTEKIMKNLSGDVLEKMLRCEYGGMCDVLVNLYSVTGEKRYLDLSYKFHDKFIMDELAKRVDPMPGKHSNTNVPKAVGAARRYELIKDEKDKTIASFFWETMVHHHSYVIGGNSSYEYCGEEDKLSDRLSDNTCETCNTYNMLKLTKHLFQWQPSGELGDYYERALYNHILASQNPEDGMMCYFVPLRMGTHKIFSDQFNTFTCCVGTGMENHSKYTESIYFRGKDGSLYVNLFIPSELNWKEKGVVIRQETNFPEGEKTSLIFKSEKAQQLKLYIRDPKWANGKVSFKWNGKEIKAVKDASGYLVLNVKTKKEDILEISLPMSLHTESMTDNKNRIAFLYGPVVLAAQLGETMPDPVYGTPVMLTDNRNVAEWMKAKTNEALTFEMKGVGKPFDPVLKPFYKTYKDYYSVYFDYFTMNEWNTRQTDYENEKKQQQAIEDRTIDNFRIGEMQPERDHNLVASQLSYVSEAYGRMGREARGQNYFAFDMNVKPEFASNLMFTYFGDDKYSKFDLLIDGEKVATPEWNGGKNGKFYDVEYEIPSRLLTGKTKINIRIEANYPAMAGRIFGVRIVKR